MHSSLFYQQDRGLMAKPTEEQAHAEPILIFLHMPRSGGTTLNRLIEWEYGAMSVFAVDPHFYRWSYNALARAQAVDLPDLKALQGHMPFGVHTLLNRPAIYITMLRDPIQRVISEYYFRLHRPLRHPREHREVRGLSLEDYIRTTPRHNVQTKLAAGCGIGYDFLEGPCTADTLAMAEHNLSRYFGLVGLTERFDEFLALAKVLFGWKIRRHGSFHIERRRPRTDSVSASIRDLIRDRYRYDVALYEYGVRLFNEAVAKDAAQVRVEMERIGNASNLSAVESISFRARSFAFKTISRIHSAALVMTGRANTRRHELAA